MRAQVIRTDKAPTPVGPYSQAIRTSAGTLLFLAGQVGLDPATGKLVEGGIEPQTRRVLANLREVLAAGGCTPADVVKTTIFLADLGDFATVNAIYGEVFSTTPPARSTVQAARLPLGALVEIEAIAAPGA